MAIHRKRKHRIQQQTAAQITSTNQQSAVQGLMIRSLVPKEPTGETDFSIFFLFQDNKQQDISLLFSIWNIQI